MTAMVNAVSLEENLNLRCNNVMKECLWTCLLSLIVSAGLTKLLPLPTDLAYFSICIIHRDPLNEKCQLHLTAS